MKQGRAVSDKFGSTLLYYREKQGLSLQKLSEMTGISQSYLNRLEKSERKCPAIGISCKIAKALNIPLTTLLDISTNETAVEEAQTISQLLLYNDFKIVEDKVISKDIREILVEIIEFIITCTWSEETKIGDILELSELIDDFKQEIKN